MGQQQLLLVILVTIIVGIATVVAINTFSSAADSANIDAVRQDLASMAASAQGYYMKPNMMGGGGNDFSNITFNDITVPGTVTDGTNANNENGDYVLGDKEEPSFTITASPSSGASDMVALVCADGVDIGNPGDTAPNTCPDGSSAAGS